MQTSIYKMDKQQGPTVKHRELYSMSCDKPEWKIIFMCMCVCVCVCVATESLCSTIEINTMLYWVGQKVHSGFCI